MAEAIHRISAGLNPLVGPNGLPFLFRPNLPELPSPEKFSGPLFDSDFSEYLAPLYDRGWTFSVERPNSEAPVRGALTRTFKFPALEGLVEFSQNTRDLSGASISVARNLDTDIHFPSSGSLTRDQIRLAFYSEIEYFKILGYDAPAPYTNPKPQSRIMSLENMRTAEQTVKSKRKQKPRHPVRVPIVTASLPPPPPIPAILPPPLTDADLETYIKPLVAAGWTLVGPKALLRYPKTQEALQDHLCLHRRYHFTDYNAARHFLHAAIAAIPRTPSSFAGVDVRLRSTATPGVYTVVCWAISELAPEAPTQYLYGISLADVRFAINVENVITNNWAWRAESNPLNKDAWVPKTVEEMWQYTDNKRLLLDAHRSL
ncbi:hypothetical protein B0H11DRAFT_2327026 [Mycena galericulata]|nr:hypothetical protein B0H11DRAFT_2327026 [Mycena galericulata]